jgi:uncharacterized protein (DUF58 family)
MNLAQGETKSWTYTLTGRRGYFPFSQIHVDVPDRLGVRTQPKTFQTDGQLLVLPHLMKIKRVAIRPRKTRVYSGEIPARSGGLGVDFYGVREYQHGDSPRWINWRASARYSSRLYSNDFEQERVSDVGIILDGRERSNFISGRQSIFDYSVLAAANLANAFIAQGDRVSLLHYGKYLKWTFPAYGKIQREKILRELSQAEPGSSLVFSQHELSNPKVIAELLAELESVVELKAVFEDEEMSIYRGDLTKCVIIEIMLRKGAEYVAKPSLITYFFTCPRKEERRGFFNLRK